MVKLCKEILVLIVLSTNLVHGLLSAPIYDEPDTNLGIEKESTVDGNSGKYDDNVDKNKSLKTDDNARNSHSNDGDGDSSIRRRRTPYERGKRHDYDDNDDNYAFDEMPPTPDGNTDDDDEELLNDRPYPQSAAGRFPTPAERRYESSAAYPYGRRQSPDKLMYTREIAIKQGRLKGIVRNMHPQTGLRDVDQFLGLPYAEAPVGSRRFMPPGAALPWNGVKIARHLPPVCPQNLPDLSNANGKMSKGRSEQLNRLLPYLKNENEDCLHLNVYVPRDDGLEQNQKYPVIVYVHGESFEWNSGNPYDGSVLASYGQVIVVTLNYRLGVLGFMKPGISENTVSNFGLLDQIAALHWIKENIVSFGGDKDSVTLMGHGTGAACVNFLMVSPVADGLFHRSILMSGSAMADWATSNHSLQLTMQIAEGLNCPLNDDDEEMLTCLRRKRYQDMQKVPISVPQFSTRLGPIVDGHVIPNQPYKVMSQYTELFSRYDLLFGITEVESYHILNPLQLEEGLRKSERDDLLHFYMQNRFEIRPDLAFAMTMKRYTDIYNNPIKQSSIEHRDATLDILSDARVVGPLMQTGLFHADVNPRNYMYVFGHNSAAGPYSHLQQSIPGEELAFIFGAPLAPAGPFHQKYSVQEKLLSEAVMAYWTNFAKTGNPKAPWKGTFLNLHALEWERYDVDWPEFNKRNQCYINIGIPPSIGYKYRNVYMNYWNKELPDELNHIGTLAPFEDIHATNVPRGGTSVYPPEIITGHLSNFPSRKNDKATENPLRQIKLLLKEPPNLEDTHETAAENMYNAPPTFGVVKSEPDYDHTTEPTTTVEENSLAKSEGTIHILIGLLVVFIVLNVFIYSAYLFRGRAGADGASVVQKLTACAAGTPEDDVKRTKHVDGGGCDESYVLDIVRKSNTYEAVHPGHSPINGFKITRQLSSSTVDTHTKVSDWMSRDLFKAASPKSSPSLKGKRFLGIPRKINVAVDATPQARSDSILRQEPIEVTKRNIIICQDVVDDDVIYSPSTQTIKIDHKHSRSDPVDMYYTLHKNDEKVTSFIGNDINVTSRDSVEKDPLSVAEQLQTIKRRNFPKVLPNYPSEGEERMVGGSFKRNSLPPNSFNIINQMGKMAPVPPPRTISTLGRGSSLRRSSNSITTSPLMLAEDCAEEDEPEISQNTLIVGPIVPKNHESNYSTIKRQASVQGPPNKSFDTIAIAEEGKQSKPSGIKPPTTTFQPMVAIANRQAKSNIPRVHHGTGMGPGAACPSSHSDALHFGISRIPQLRSTFASSSSASSSFSADRDKSSPESSSSDTTNSSTGTVKTELKQK